MSVSKAHKLFDTIYQISNRHLAKQPNSKRKKLGGRKKKVIRTKAIGLSTEKWEDLITRTKAKGLSTEKWKDLIIIRTKGIGLSTKKWKGLMKNQLFREELKVHIKFLNN